MRLRGLLLRGFALVILGQAVVAMSQSSLALASNQPTRTDNVIPVSCAARGIDNEMMHLLDVMPLFELSKPSVAQPIDMSADYPGMSLSYYDIKLPRTLYLSDTNAMGTPTTLKSNLVYGFAQHSHGEGKLPNHTLLVVERLQVLKHRKSRIWVDVNHNLDLTDDPVQFYTPTGVSFSAAEVPNAESLINLDANPWGVALQLGFFTGGELKSYQKLYGDAVNLVRGERNFVGVGNSFRQRRMSVVWGAAVHKADTLYWALKDVNLNGKYSDVGVDMVMVSNDNGLFNTANAWKIVKGKTILDWLGQGWSIEVWEKPIAGSSLVWGMNLEPIDAGKVKNSRSLLIGQRVPKFRFCVIEGAYKPGKLKENPVHRRNIRKFKGKYTVLLVWNADDTMYLKDSATYHAIGRSLPDSVQMIMLNHGGSGRYVYGYNRRYETKMIHGFCSPGVTEKLKLQTMPQVFLLDPKQRLIDINMSPFELQNRINGTLR